MCSSANKDDGMISTLVKRTKLPYVIATSGKKVEGFAYLDSTHVCSLAFTFQEICVDVGA